MNYEPNQVFCIEIYAVLEHAKWSHNGLKCCAYSADTVSFSNERLSVLSRIHRPISLCPTLLCGYNGLNHLCQANSIFISDIGLIHASFLLALLSMVVAASPSLHMLYQSINICLALYYCPGLKRILYLLFNKNV